MESRARLFGHPIHQQLIVFPLGLLATAVIFDLLSFFTADRAWTAIAQVLIGVGLITGLIAAVFGFLDYQAIPSGTRAKRIGAIHGLANTLVILLFALSFWLRSPEPAFPSALAYAFSYGGGLVALFGGWLGGELVSRLGVGVSDTAGLNAPNSLTHKTPRTRVHSPTHSR